jgi:hypothetical protein
MSLASDDPEHVIVVPGRHFAPTASAGSAMAVSADEVEGDLAQEGEVAGGGALAHPAVILTEGDVEHPVQGVVSRPEGFHLQPLAEPDVNLSAHPAPIIQLTTRMS